MRKWSVWALSAVAVALAFTPGPSPAGEADPWAGENDETREKMEELAEEEITGRLDDEQRDMVHKYWASHLRRCAMDGVDSARYSIAELKLQRGDAKGAVAALGEIAASTANAEVRSLAHLNLGEIHRRHLNDADGAVKHYLQVAGVQRHMARHCLLRMCDEMGKADVAAKAVEAILPGVKEKGEKLALLHQLAALYRRLNQADQALATYERIAKEFTAADAREMREAAVREVREAVDKMIALRQRDRDGDDEAAERIAEQLEARRRELRLARRMDELKAFEEAMEQGEAKLRKAEEQRERREEEKDAPKKEGEL
ncbi:MAG TPA: hypothetical protein PLE19_03230 [Planctomycetota bacterium]|nr:hypothetical protein [Planctomycetota bacterium]HRR79637.1 hypothetical protein [Planctomycetota bacterium]HRT95106.1 hypothetical protein [Planctomycetota bacterium]